MGMGWWPWYGSVITRRTYVKPSTPENNLRLLQRMQVDYVVGSPAQLSDIVTLLRQTNTSLPDVAVVHSGGSPLSRQLHDEIKQLTGATIVNAYGSTEVGPTTLRTDDESDPNYMGELLPGTEIEIVDPDTDSPLPEGITGLIRVRRHTMVHRYFRDEDTTARSWRDGWFYSGDRGHLSGNRLYINGRIEEILNIGGSKVDPASIDAHFAQYPALTDCAAFGVVDDLGIERVGLAFVSPEPVSQKVLHDSAAPVLRANAPVVYWRIDRIPRNEMGKVLRNELRERYRAILNTGAAEKP
jgi:acyl-coenzyme A synthetase/AMP-(fatty) acid ligase